MRNQTEIARNAPTEMDTHRLIIKNPGIALQLIKLGLRLSKIINGELEHSASIVGLQNTEGKPMSWEKFLIGLENIRFGIFNDLTNQGPTAEQALVVIGMKKSNQPYSQK